LDDYSCLRGANYVPSYARNDVQIWMDYDAAVVDRELGYAAKLKLNCVRVFLQVAVYEHDPRRFLDSFESFLSLCEKHRIQMMPVIFDSCFGEFPDLKKYRDKDWMACPGQNRLGPEHWPALQKYIADIVGAHRDDKRILMWDVMNEPTCTSFYKTAEDKQLIHTFLRRALDWVKAQKPNQPRTVGLMSSDELGLVQDQVDVLCFHNYRRDLREDIRKVQELGRQQGKPTIINEVVGRPQQGFEFAMPILREEKIGWCFWELMLGKTQFSRDHNSPYQGLIYPDGTIYDAAEAAAVMDESSVKAAWLFPQRRWTREQAWAWYMQRPWIVGFNYVPSTAANTTEFWSAETFDEKTIDRELDWGAGLGFNCCRVFVQHLVWKHDPAGLKQRLDKFLSLAHKHGLSTTLVLFDDCAFGDPPQTEPYLGKQRDPIPGMILPSWTPSPGHKTLADSGAWPSLEKYVKDIVGTFGQDRRVLMWDLYNEPSRSLPLVEATFGWARAANPSQPLTMGPWGGPSEFSRRQLELSDVISFHFYGNRDDLRTQIANYKNYLRPVINTEWMARLQGSRWETDLPLFKQEAVGCYSWGLVNGRTQCQFAWHHKRGTPEPRVWFHDLFHRDGQPYDLAEHEDIRKITADKSIAWAAADYSQMQTKPGLAPHTEDGIT
ncbi:MAG: cellulase family glycosylhydrolase, partial [Verrucomicrobia bacterium]|nr:cellulase family glycosylhydrolase [Verrucomicrobiota bacterium]